MKSGPQLLDNNPEVVGPSEAPLPRGRRALEVLAAEQLQELQTLNSTMTAAAARMSGRITNNTLLTATYQFATPADGGAPAVQIDCRAAAGAIRVTNASTTATVTVAPGPNQGYAPTSGVGVALVLPLSRDTIALVSHQITLYGTAGDKVTVQVFTSGVEPTT